MDLDHAPADANLVLVATGTGLAPYMSMLRTTLHDAVVTALDGRFIRPAPGGDLLRNPDVLPTGRNLHGFDPFALPDEAALRQGQAQAERLLVYATEPKAKGARPALAAASSACA